MQELVSIITPTFNAAKFLAETIQSVQNQSYENWELFLIDDCSTDETVAIAQEFCKKDTRIQLLQLAQNSGAGVARNKGIECAKGTYISFIDADDLWKPEKLAKQIAFMKLHNLPFTFTFYDQIDENGNLLNISITCPTLIDYKMLFYCNWIGNLTGIYKVAFFGKIPISSIKKRQDWILWLEIVKQIDSAFPVPESLAFYRIRKDSLSASKFQLLKHNYFIYKNYHKNNTVQAVFNLLVFLMYQLLIKPRYKKSLNSH